MGRTGIQGSDISRHWRWQGLRLRFGAMVSRNLLFPALALSALLLVSAPVNAVEGGAEGATVRVECTHASSLINISILHERRIGKVKITVCDANGKVFYIEEGKALKNELVRRIDKQGMTKGEMTLTVEAHDFRIEQRFLVQ